MAGRHALTRSNTTTTPSSAIAPSEMGRAANAAKAGPAGGVGIGGIGLSTIDAAGEVYNLRDFAQFPGT